MPRVYTIYMTNVNITPANGVRTLAEFTAHTNRAVELLAAEVSQINSEVSTMEALEIVRKSAAGTGTAFTAVPLDPDDAAFGGTARTNMTAEGTISATLTPFLGWNILNGWLWVPKTEADRLFVPGAGILGVRVAQALEVALDMSCMLTVKEIG